MMTKSEKYLLAVFIWCCVFSAAALVMGKDTACYILALVSGIAGGIFFNVGNDD